MKIVALFLIITIIVCFLIEHIKRMREEKAREKEKKREKTIANILKEIEPREKFLLPGIKTPIDPLNVNLSELVFEKPTEDKKSILNFPSEAKKPTREKLRPKDFEHFIGQDRVKKVLKMIVQSSKMGEEPVRHLLLTGWAGTGKTTLAYIIANNRNVKVHSTIGGGLSDPIQITELLGSLEPNDIFFIDEIHRIKPNIAEFLYRPLEEFTGDLVMENGRTETKFINPFTLIGATTDPGLLLKPFRDRCFPISLDKYTVDNIRDIVLQSASILEINLNNETGKEIAKRSKWTPRISNSLLLFLQDYVRVRSIKDISPSVVKDAMEYTGIDELGLNPIDRNYLVRLYKCPKYTGGLKTLVASTGQDMITIEEIIEPYILQINFIDRTSKGRVLTEEGRRYVEALNDTGY